MVTAIFHSGHCLACCMDITTGADTVADGKDLQGRDNVICPSHVFPF